MLGMNDTTRSIFLVDDDQNDRMLIKRAFEKLDMNISVNTASNWEEAKTKLVEFIGSTEEQTLDLIILDLKLPGKSGFDILRWIRKQEKIKYIPVIILSSSSHDKDILKSYRLGANSYLIKPVRFDDLINIAKTIKNYWFDINKQPDQ